MSPIATATPTAAPATASIGSAFIAPPSLPVAPSASLSAPFNPVASPVIATLMPTPGI